MATRIAKEVSITIAETAGLCDVDVVAAYPITPQTHVVEHLSEMVADGHLDAEFVPVESEHAAMSCCCGSSAAGARTFTATASQGLALMHEILFIASSLRLPILMVVANRSLSGPISIWNDHSDVMTERDVGWIQLFAENGQEASDLIIQGFRMGEHENVLLPVMVHFDGFILSHVIEPVMLPDREEVKEFLPDYKPVQRLDVDNPISMGPVGIPPIYTESKMASEAAIREAYPVIVDVMKKFGEKFGRTYHPVESYKTEDADIIFITMGGISETAMTWLDGLRDKGEKAGLVRFRLWRPFPDDEFRKAIAGAKVLAVVDRHFSPGGTGGPVAQEIKTTLFNDEKRPKIAEFVAGLGGRDITFGDFDDMYAKARALLKGGSTPPFELVQVRGGHYGAV